MIVTLIFLYGLYCIYPPLPFIYLGLRFLGLLTGVIQ